MDLLKSYFRDAIWSVQEKVRGLADLYHKDFGSLAFEKYLALRTHQSAKRTWFFRTDFKMESRSARYLFFFGYASDALRGKASVTLHISHEHPMGSYYYAWLRDLPRDNIPRFLELGYVPDEGRLVVLFRDGKVEHRRMDVVAREFVEDVVRLHFSGRG